MENRLQARVTEIRNSAEKPKREKRKKKSPAKRRIASEQTKSDDGEFEQRIRGMTVKELKSVLDERGLSKQGRKADLQRRLLDDWESGGSNVETPPATSRKSKTAGKKSATSKKKASTSTRKRKTAPRAASKPKKKVKSPAKKSKAKKSQSLTLAEAKKRKIAQLQKRLEIRADALLSPPKRTRRSSRRGKSA
eukprot:g3523.t1